MILQKTNKLTKEVEILDQNASDSLLEKLKAEFGVDEALTELNFDRSLDYKGDEVRIKRKD